MRSLPSLVPARLANRTFLAVAAASLVSAGCGRAPDPDAYGNVEATEVVVGAETSGQLLRFDAVEGNRLPAGAVAALIDTTALALQLNQIVAQREAATANAAQVARQVGVLEAQREIARRSYERTQRLFAQQAATAQQLDQTERDYRTLVRQIAATRAQREAATLEAASTEARAAQIRDQLRKARVRNPIGGTVLTTYVEAGELVQNGQPLYKIASLDTMEVRAYVTEPQLAHLRIGQPARVSVDVGPDRRRELPGRVSWISSQAEFTPTPIQTRDERSNLVYAVKVRLANRDGVLKIGMPADVRFPVETASR
ncbi:MAG TPA: HlyD family efflux transporter periplasmic adaptor subunit [Gemmatimonadaceae bacterium]